MSSIIEYEGTRTIGPEPVGPAEPATSPAEPTPPADAAETTPTTEPDTFDRKYVEELRAENAKWRTQLREKESLFEGLEPDEVAQLAEFARLSKKAEAGDQEAIAQLNEMLGGGEAPAEEEASTEPAPAPVFDEEHFRKLAREEAERIASDRDARRQQQQDIETVHSTVEKMGYPRNSEDHALFLRALVEHMEQGKPPDEAHYRQADEAVKAYKARIVEEYLAVKEGRTNASPAVPSGSGVAPSSARPPSSFAEARDSLRQRIDAARGR